MNNIIMINFEEQDFEYPQKAETVKAGKCPAIIPMSVLSCGDSFRGLYNTEGFIRLSELNNISAAMILTIAERSLECTEICRDYLLFPGEYVLTADTVYISEDFYRAKLTYIPQKKVCSEASELSCFIQSLKPLTTENGKTYLDALRTLLECRNLRFSRVIGFIEQLKQEINFCGIE